MENKSEERDDAIELLLGKTHRCCGCKKAFEQTRDGPEQCPYCNCDNIMLLKGMEKCIV